MKHPAKYSDAILPILRAEIERLRGPNDRYIQILDPFAGTGRIHELGGGGTTNTFGIEIEPEWAEMHPLTDQGDATNLPYDDEVFDAVITSPVYGNRMSDHHDAKDGTTRHTYKHYLGRDLHPNNAGQLQWGAAYRDLHRKAWSEAVRVLRPGGKLIINVSNHIRKGVEEEVVQWHLGRILIDHEDMRFVRTIRVETPRQRHGENGKARVDCEHVLVIRKAY